MAKPGKLDRFDHLLPAQPWINPWQPDGSYRSDLELLSRLLDVAVGTSQQSGVVAGAADVWAAEELRRAGFHADEGGRAALLHESCRGIFGTSLRTVLRRDFARRSKSALVPRARARHYLPKRM